MIQDEEFFYDFKYSLELHAANWFRVDEIFKHVQDHQIRNRELPDDDTSKFREYENLPLSWDQMDWHDKRFLEEYICNRTKIWYQQKNLYDAINTDPYDEVYKFNFNCELLDIVSSLIRLHYWIPVLDDNYRAEFTHSDDPNAEPVVNLTTIFFKRSSEFSAQIFGDFSSDLFGLSS